MNDFDVVSINMAKNQLLALNIQKLSGQCGKLMCCLKFEDSQYKLLPFLILHMPVKKTNPCSSMDLFTSYIIWKKVNTIAIIIV